MLTATGVSEEDSITVGPSKLLKSTNKDAKFGYVESNGSGLDQGWKDLQNTSEAIDSAPARLRVENKGNVTATAAAIDSEDSHSGLKAVAHGYEDSIRQMFIIIAEIMGLEEGGEVELHTNFGVKKGTDPGMQELGKARTDGTLSKDAWIREMQWRGELSPDFDVEANSNQREADPGMSKPTPEDIANAAAKKAAREAAKKSAIPPDLNEE